MKKKISIFLLVVFCFAQISPFNIYSDGFQAKGSNKNRVEDVATFVDKNLTFVDAYSDKGVFIFKKNDTEDNVLIDGNGKIINGAVYDEIKGIDEISTLKSNNKIRLYQKVALNKFGQSSIDSKYTDLRYYPDDMVYVFQKIVKGKYKYGILDKNGSVICEPMYDDILDFNKGLAPVRNFNKFGIIDKSGKVVIDFKYHNLDVADEDAIVVSDYKGMYLINKDAKRIGNKHYDAISKFNKNALGFANIDDEYFVLDNKGKEVYKLPDKYDYILDINDNNMLRVRIDNDIDYITVPNYTLNSKFDNYYTTEIDGVYKIIKNEKYGLCDENFNIIVPINYYNIYPLSVDNKPFSYQLVKKNENKRKESIFMPQNRKLFEDEKYSLKSYYPEEYMNSNYQFALIFVKKDGEELYGVTNGKKTILEPKYKQIIISDEFIYTLDSKRYFEKKGDKYSKFDFNGKLIEEFDPTKSLYYQEGVGFAKIFDSNTARYVDESGNCIVEDDFEQITPFINGVCVVRMQEEKKFIYAIVELAKLKKLGGIE